MLKDPARYLIQLVPRILSLYGILKCRHDTASQPCYSISCNWIGFDWPGRLVGGGVEASAAAAAAAREGNSFAVNCRLDELESDVQSRLE